MLIFNILGLFHNFWEQTLDERGGGIRERIKPHGTFGISVHRQVRTSIRGQYRDFMFSGQSLGYFSQHTLYSAETEDSITIK